ncbi:branched-chain amino acid ABC transporter permease [Desertimonas flava]|uniref:branched-chain amino acid ABC transporter permease n=1 Tax=Desertimonas flava TaxID=2064846 RepID=UPI000E345F4B|nr:branched-chain amino acid ABC transporter permease [Desertimonas flava]
MLNDVIAQTLLYGVFYGLLASSFSIVYRATNVFNFAQGELVMLGGMLTAQFLVSIHGNVLIAGALALVGVAAIGLLTDAAAIRPVQRRDPQSHMWVISTLAVSLLIGDIAGKYWDTDPRFTNPPLGLSTRGDWPLGLSQYAVAMMVFIVLILIGIDLFDRSRWGRATLAVAENREAAMLRGIRPQLVGRLALIGGSVVGGLAGLLISPILYASIALGPMMLIKGFMAAGIGGIGNPRGGLIGGLLIALAEAVTATYFSPGYQSVITFALLLAVLMVRPQGLMSTAGAVRV